MKRVLVNDRPLHAAQTGVAMYLQNVLAHWPQDAQVELEGFWEHQLKRNGHWPHRQDELQSTTTVSYQSLKPIQLVPLSMLLKSRPAPCRPSFFKRWLLTGGHAMAFRMTARLKHYAAMWEPNHLVITTGLPSISTIHDLSVLEYPQWHPADRVRHWEKHTLGAIEHTIRWIAVSQFTADRMTTLLGIPPRAIDVIPLAARPMSFPAREQAISLLLAAGVSKPYFLVLGTIEPRKNLNLLLDAWVMAPTKLREMTQLIIAGGAGWGHHTFWRSLIEHPAAPEVMTAGYVSHSAAAALMAGATALLLPSQYEGFGLPLLEAMAAGIPVLCSDIPVFREVAGDAAGLFPPDNPSAWAQALARAATDATWTTQLRDKGYRRLRLFSWQITSRRHAETIAAVASKRPNGTGSS